MNYISILFVLFMFFYMHVRTKILLMMLQDVYLKHLKGKLILL